MADNEPGRRKYPTGDYTVGMFRDVTSAGEFAATLGVPIKSIALIEPTNHLCTHRGCKFNAIKRNHDFCPAHRRGWFALLNHRGEALNGPEFLRQDGVRDCSCNEATCSSAGYYPGRQHALYICTSGLKTVANAPGLLDEEKVSTIRNGGKPKIYLYPWHFFPEHLKKDGDGKLVLDYDKDDERTYYDTDKFTYPFPPPRNVPQKFVDEYLNTDYVRPQERWIRENPLSQMPTWMLNMLAIDCESAGINLQQTGTTLNPTQLARELEMYRARSRQLFNEKKEQEDISEALLQKAGVRHKKELAEVKSKHGDEMAGTKRKYEAIIEEKDGVIRGKEEQVTELEDEIKALSEQLEKLRSELEECRKNINRPLRFEDLKPGGLLSKHVKSCTFFDTFDMNNIFLDILNFADGSPGSFPKGDGLLENIRTYSDVKRDERDGKVDPPTFDMDSPQYKSWLQHSTAARLSRSDGRTFKDDYLAFCIYVHAGTTEEFAAVLCGISVSRMSNILHGWAQVLDDGLCEWFPRPSRSQLLRAFPQRFLEADGDARTTLLLDAFECFSESSSNPNVSSSTHSDYKSHNTVKCLGAVDPIGCSWDGTVSDGYPGKASDVMMTKDTKILRQVHCGHTGKVDKGFLVNNIAAAEGVNVDRPQIRKKKQVQQSSADTSQTQKVGNTRIIVENVNGEMKSDLRYLNAMVHTTQFPVVSKLIRIGYLMQNFKKAIIQNNNYSTSTGEDGRPCRAEIRWYGATDDGLIDIRGDIYRWGLDCEIKLHEQLSAMEEHEGKSTTEISEMVLDRRLDLELRKELYRRKGKVYDGGDL